MSRHSFIVGVHFVVASLIGCGSNDHSSADGGLGGDGTTGGSGEDGSGASSGGASSGSSGGASSGASSGGASSSGGGDGSSPTADGGAQADAGAYDPSVYQHHKNGTRNGVYIDPVLTSGTTGNAATMHVLSGFMGTMTTATYAQPLYVEKGVGGAETFIVATEGNHVTAINATTGATLWDQGPTDVRPPGHGWPALRRHQPARDHGHAVHRSRVSRQRRQRRHLLRRDDDAGHGHVQAHGLCREALGRHRAAQLAGRRDRQGERLHVRVAEPARRPAARQRRPLRSVRWARR